MNRRAIDVHSVTCALCGGEADERETVSLWDEDYAEYDGYMTEERTVYVPDLPNGEAHEDCFDERVER